MPKKNIIHERTTFNPKNQLQGESVELFISTLHDMVRHCNFDVNESENIRDRLKAGMSEKNCRRNSS